MNRREIKRILILSIPYVVLGLIATNIGEAWLS
jgi:type IV secretion system protein VirD4